MEGVLDVLTEHEFTLVIAYPGHGAAVEPPASLPPIFANSEVDGALLFGGQAMVQRLRQTPGFGKRPLVSLVNPIPEECPSVIADDEQGGYLAGCHLFELGHRHLVHFFQNSFHVHSQRYHGMCRACEEYGLDPAVHLYAASWYLGNIAPPHHLELPGEETSATNEHIRYMQQEFVAFMRAHPEFTAVVTPNDATARRVWYLLKRDGRQIPGEISVVGYDDVDTLLDEQGHNILTAVRMPLVEIGRTAADLIIRCILGHVTENTITTLPTSLSVRASTGRAGE